MLKGLVITTVVGTFVVLELCTEGIEYRPQNGKQYRGNMSKARTPVVLAIPITFVGVGMGFMVAAARTQVLVVSTVSALTFLEIPSILGVRAYNKSLKQKPLDVEVQVFRITF